MTKPTPDKSHSDSEVHLPNNVPLRSKEKATLLHTSLDEYIRVAGLFVSYVSGICFILVGASLIASNTIAENSTWSLTAATGDATINQETTRSLDTTEKIDTDAPTPPPSLIRITDMVREISESFTIRWSVENVIDFKAILLRLDTNERITLPYTAAKDTYSVVIPGDTLEPGEYMLRAIARNPVSTYTLETPSFTVPSVIEENADTFNSIYTPETTESAEDATEAPALETNDIDTTQDTQNTTEDIRTRFRMLARESDTVSGRTSFVIAVPSVLSNVQLYARPTNSLQSRFIGKALPGSATWYAPVDTTNLPNGQYELFATANHHDGLLESSSIVITVTNTSATAPTRDLSNDTNTAPSRDNTTENRTAPVREFATTDFETTTTESDVREQTRELLNSNKPELETLLRRYAVAVQSGDPTVIALAERALEKKREELAMRALNDPSTSDISDNINVELAERLGEIKKRIEMFEDLRAQRSSGTSTIDSDQDGITDADERALYNTDPFSADTDNDGIPDGVEIASGYNPTNAASEATIRYESPKETVGVVREDIFTVSEVRPVVTTDETTDTTKTYTEIRGTALPNSFVTLHIFSTPTVVTVKTNAEGIFEYTYEKELEDGTHDVYVAITDNTGWIVAQSNPFTFVKEAQAFTPVDASESAAAGNVSVVESNQSYGMTIGLSILSFGLILLMLGTTLRRNAPKEHIVAT